MFKRARYQFGYLRRKPRKSMPDIWAWERNTTSPDGRRKRTTVIVGTVEQYPTEAQAWRAAESLRLAVNSAAPNENILFGALVDRYVREKLPKRHSTASKYRSWITHHVKPKWGGTPISEVKPLLVEEWLTGLALAPKSKGHVRSIMHILFNWAMKWELTDIARMNPIGLVRVRVLQSVLGNPEFCQSRNLGLSLTNSKSPYEQCASWRHVSVSGQANSWGCSGATLIGKPLKSTFNGES